MTDLGLDADQDRDGTRCGPCGRRLSHGWTLCQRCVENLGDDLLEIADRYRHLTAVSGYQPGRYDRSGGGKPGSRPPGRVDVMALRDFRSGHIDATTWRGGDGRQHAESERDTPAVLRAVLGWCETVADERGFTHRTWEPTIRWTPIPPLHSMTDHDEMTGAVDHDQARALHRQHRKDRAAQQAADVRTARHPARRITAAASWLARQDDWLARWAHGPDLHAAARLLRNRLRAATGEPNPRPMAHCIALVPQPDGPDRECGAAVVPPPTDRGDGFAHLPAVRCTGPHRHEYTRSDLARLALAAEQARRTREAG